MSKKLLGICAFAVIIGSLVLMVMNPNRQVFSESEVVIQTPAPREVYLGAWAGGFWDSESKTLTTGALTAFQSMIGKKVAIANMFAGWKYLSDPDLIHKLNEISRNNWTPMISSNPSFFEECRDEKNGSLYKTIASGSCDQFLHKAAQNLKSYEKPIFFRFAWEMNLPSMWWSVDKVKSNPEEFIAAWKHFHDILKMERADNVIWVLSFNTSSSVTIPYAKLYPGDAYVDWVAIDGYNWGDTQPWGGWNSFNGVFRKSYDELTAVSQKPVMLSEVNSASSGGNKAKWLADMLDTQIPENYPAVSAIVFFNENKFDGESVDWRMEISSDNLTTLQNSLSKDLYRSYYP